LTSDNFFHLQFTRHAVVLKINVQMQYFIAHVKQRGENITTKLLIRTLTCSCNKFKSCIVSCFSWKYFRQFVNSTRLS